jgi:site-specific DNA recombinase
MVDVIWSDTNFPTIFTWEEYQEHSERMRRRQFYGTSKNAAYWFTGVLRCARCGRGIFAKPQKRANGYATLYLCSGRTQFKTCDLPILGQHVAEKLIMDFIRKIKLAYDEVSASDERQQEREVKSEDRLKDLQKDLSQVQARKKKWQYMFAEDLITESEFRERKHEDDRAEEIIKNQMEEAKANTIGSSADKLGLLIGLPELWDEIDDADKRELMQTIFESIFIDCDVKSGKGISGKGRSLPFRVTDVIYN